MDPEQAARRWAETWTAAWLAHDVEAVAEERDVGEVRFGTPLVEGDRAFVEYWATSVDRRGEPTTLAGCAIARFDADGLVTEARDYWHVEAGHHTPPAEWGR
jgi:hypothetical protein